MFDDSNNDSDDSEPVGRKRANRDTWKRQVTKMKKLSGAEHVNHRGKLIKERSVGPPCTCKKKCMDNLSDTLKQCILRKFNSMESKNMQDTYLAGLISTVSPSRSRPRLETARKPHSAVYYYRIKFGNEEKVVCKQAFLALHGITTGQLRRISTLVQQGVFSPVDKRGGAREACFIAEDLKIQVCQHIRSYPHRVAHYGKSGRKTRYLASDLNIHLMWQHYLQKYEPEMYTSFKANPKGKEKPKIKYEYFLNLYKDNFNYPFGKPRTDVCSTCEKLTISIKSEANDALKRQIKSELSVHKANAKRFYTDMKECKLRVVKGGLEYGKSEAISFDYMQNIPFPMIPVTEMFFARQLWLYIFGIHRMSDDRAFFYVYTELTGKKTPNEVVSMLNHFIKRSIGDDVKNLYIFTDSCTSQNRNNTVVKYLHTLTKQGKFDFIKHTYPTRGHSYLPCDRDFGRVELKKRKKDTVYSPEEWIEMIRESQHNSECIEVQQHMIQDWKNALAAIKTPYPLIKPVKGPRSLWKVTSYKLAEYRGNAVTTSTTPGCILTETFLFPKHNTSFILKPAYDKEIPLKIAKAQDISKYLGSIEQPYQEQYQRLLNSYGKKISTKTSSDDESASDAWQSEED